MRVVFVALFSVIINACSTVYTINNAEEGLVMEGSYCKNIDHIFSGLEYNWCRLNGTPKQNHDPIASKGEFGYVGIDSIFSLFADLMVLPYTVYKQVSSDPIEVRSGQR